MTKQIKSKTGKFYIGDVCYVLNDTIYDNIWGEKYNYANGMINAGVNSFLVHGTQFGDGVYPDQFGNTYPVDAGVIGVVPYELIDPSKLQEAYRLGQIVNGNAATLDYDRGSIIITITNDKEIIEYKIKTN